MYVYFTCPPFVGISLLAGTLMTVDPAVMAGVVFRAAVRGRTACPQQDRRSRAEGGAAGSSRGALGNLRRTLAGDASGAQLYSREGSLTTAPARRAICQYDALRSS